MISDCNPNVIAPAGIIIRKINEEATTIPAEVGGGVFDSLLSLFPSLAVGVVVVVPFVKLDAVVAVVSALVVVGLVIVAVTCSPHNPPAS
mmetsp:Transcript_670/g.837  ORF Transcript_670/g.837 Transcript_670/m.837 type:complete len:90 (+) Transcript_670:158-427(+)